MSDWIFWPLMIWAIVASILFYLEKDVLTWKEFNWQIIKCLFWPIVLINKLGKRK